MQPFIITAVILILAVCSDCGPASFPGESIGQQQQTILHGDPVGPGEYSAVVGVIMRDSDNVFMCTGTLISPHVVLTAAHCVKGFSSFSVVFGNTLEPTAVDLWDVSDTWYHPAYVGDQIVNDDIGLIRIEQDMPDGVYPLPYLTQSNPLSQSDQGVSTRFVGFGKTETGSSGTKMIGSDDIDLVCDTQSGCNFNGYRIPVSHFCHDQDPSGICFGDSGGPAFLERQQILYVAGINSFVGAEGPQDDLRCISPGCHNKVDVYENEIQEFIAGEIGSYCSSDAACQSNHCQDGVCCTTVCASCEVCNSPAVWGQCGIAPNGTSCSDGDVCNGQEQCQQGICQTGQALHCVDDNDCTEDGCDASSGCVYTPKPLGSVCGLCQTCDETGQCANQALDGTSCSDGNVCNGDEICQQGACNPGTALICEDQNSCTEDGCDPTQGCIHEDVNCDYVGGCRSTGEHQRSMWLILVIMLAGCVGLEKTLGCVVAVR